MSTADLWLESAKLGFETGQTDRFVWAALFLWAEAAHE